MDAATLLKTFIHVVLDYPEAGVVNFGLYRLYDDLEVDGTLAKTLLDNLLLRCALGRPQAVIFEGEGSHYGKALAGRLDAVPIIADEVGGLPSDALEKLADIPLEAGQQKPRAMVYENYVQRGNHARLMQGLICDVADVTHVACLFESTTVPERNLGGMQLGSLAIFDEVTGFCPTPSPTPPINQLMQVARWESSTVFDAINRSGPTNGVFRFRASDKEIFDATVGETPHFVCRVGKDNPRMHSVWFDPESQRFCFYDRPKAGKKLDDATIVQILPFAAGFAQVFEVGRHPQRVALNERFVTTGQSSRFGAPGP